MVRIAPEQRQKPQHLRQTVRGERPYERGSNNEDDANHRHLVNSAIARRKKQPFLWVKR